MKTKTASKSELIIASQSDQNLPALLHYPIAQQEPPILIMPHQSVSPEVFDRDKALTAFARLCFVLAAGCLALSGLFSAAAPI